MLVCNADKQAGGGGRGGMRKGHAQTLWELGWREELERELPGAPAKSGKGVAAPGRDPPGPGLDGYGGGGSGTLSSGEQGRARSLGLNDMVQKQFRQGN